mmetsp:Transcript_38056/g.56946  ORF Transcript_38056/g.56946 Transcript_38056/m.56946 type:complete len:101 (+) Transcript_38056:2535-2837(+)
MSTYVSALLAYPLRQTMNPLHSIEACEIYCASKKGNHGIQPALGTTNSYRKGLEEQLSGSVQMSHQDLGEVLEACDDYHCFSHQHDSNHLNQLHAGSKAV